MNQEERRRWAVETIQRSIGTHPISTVELVDRADHLLAEMDRRAVPTQAPRIFKKGDRVYRKSPSISPIPAGTKGTVTKVTAPDTIEVEWDGWDCQRLFTYHEGYHPSLAWVDEDFPSRSSAEWETHLEAFERGVAHGRLTTPSPSPFTDREVEHRLEAALESNREREKEANRYRGMIESLKDELAGWQATAEIAREGGSKAERERIIQLLNGGGLYFVMGRAKDPVGSRPLFGDDLRAALEPKP